MAEAEETQARLVEILALIRDLPASSAREKRVNGRLEQAFVLFVSAYDDYRAAAASGNLNRMEAGDRAFARGQAILRSVRADVKVLRGGPSTAAEFEWQELVNRLTALKPKADQAEFLAQRFFREWEDEDVSVERARATAVQAREAFAALARQYGQIRKPSDARLAKAVADMTRGYRLLRAAFAAYVRAIDESDQALLEAGDQKLQRGYELSRRAAEGLLDYAREPTGK